MLDELKRREIELVSPEQFLSGLEDLADLFDLPELRKVDGNYSAARPGSSNPGPEGRNGCRFGRLSRRIWQSGGSG